MLLGSDLMPAGFERAEARLMSPVANVHLLMSIFELFHNLDTQLQEHNHDPIAKPQNCPCPDR